MTEAQLERADSAYRTESILAGFVILTGRPARPVSGRIHREEWSPTVEGPVIDVAQFIEGEPECCRVLTIEDSPVGTALRHARVLVNRAASGGISEEAIMQRGAATAALVDLLELAGFATTVEILHCNFDHTGTTLSDYITIKQPNQRMDLGHVLFWTAHPAELRRISWGARDSKDTYRRFGNGNGYSEPVDPTLDPADEPDVYFPAMRTDAGIWSDPAKIRLWLEATLSELGVSLTAV